MFESVKSFTVGGLALVIIILLEALNEIAAIEDAASYGPKMKKIAQDALKEVINLI